MTSFLSSRTRDEKATPTMEEREKERDRLEESGQVVVCQRTKLSPPQRKKKRKELKKRSETELNREDLKEGDVVKAKKQKSGGWLNSNLSNPGGRRKRKKGGKKT